MGYALELFTDRSRVSTEFLCPICQDVVKEPSVLDACEHIFCTSCIGKWRQRSNTCPIDRRPILALRKPQRTITNIINELQLRCPFSSVGCTMTCRMGDLPYHDERCTFNPENRKTCDFGCGAVLTQAQRRTHSRHSCCEFLKERLSFRENEHTSKVQALEKELSEKDKLVKALETKLQIKNDEIRQVRTELVKAHKIQLHMKEYQIEQLRTQLGTSDDLVQHQKAQLGTNEARLKDNEEVIKGYQKILWESNQLEESEKSCNSHGSEPGPSRKGVVAEAGSKHKMTSRKRPKL